MALLWTLMLLLLGSSQGGEEYDCEEDGKVYVHRKFPDAPDGYKEEKTDTWQECQKKCAEMEPCKGFTWHKKNNPYKKACSLFSSHSGKIKGTAVSGPKECQKDTDGSEDEESKEEEDSQDSGCIIEKEMAYPGNDIDIGGKERHGGTKVENQEACAKLSLASDASYWTYYEDGVCFVKTSKSGRKSNPTSVSGNSECGIVGSEDEDSKVEEDSQDSVDDAEEEAEEEAEEDATDGEEEGCVIEEEIVYWGHDIKGKGSHNVKVKNQQACATLAATIEGALFWTYRPKDKKCFVKNSKEGRRAHAGRVSGSVACAGEEEYDCEEDGTVYVHRKFPDKPDGYKQQKTDTWQECQKLCAEIKPCKGFTWHKLNNHYKKACALFSSQSGKIKGTAVSGPKEC